MHKTTIERITSLTTMVKRELQGYQVGRFSKEPEFGILDLPMFGLRFKFVPHPHPDDDKFRLIIITSPEDFNEDELFLELVSAGYLYWLRQQRSTFGYMNILAHRNRWKLVIDTARKRAIQNKKGEFRVKYLTQLSKEPFMDIYHRDPTVFDWMLL
jgi:hypothetical protein